MLRRKFSLPVSQKVFFNIPTQQIFRGFVATQLQIRLCLLGLCMACGWAPGFSQDSDSAWDFAPYRVLIWMVDRTDPVPAKDLTRPLQNYLDQEFFAIWRVQIANAPAVLRRSLLRDFEQVEYDQLTANDPILAVRKDHPDAPRIRSAYDVAEYVKKVYSTPEFSTQVLQRASRRVIRPLRDVWEAMVVDGLRTAGIDPGDHRKMLIDILDNLTRTDDVDAEYLRDLLTPVWPADSEEPSAEDVSRKRALQELLEKLQAASHTNNDDLYGIRGLIDTADHPTFDDVIQSWQSDHSEAVLLPRGLALELNSPDKKLIPLELDGLLGEVFERFDKIFVVRTDRQRVPIEVDVVELDCLMRLAGPVVSQTVLSNVHLADQIGRAITRAYSPTVRIEEATTNKVEGRLRAGGLILNPESPAALHDGDFLQPALRKDDRFGDPLILEALDWAYLHVNELDGPKIKMELFAGRQGGIQGRRNKRTHRMAFRIRDYHPHTEIRLHAQKRPDVALQGYEFYEKELDSPAMTFVGRTDWDGRLVLEKTDRPLRLLYVKNGGAVLARLPCVPGQDLHATADLRGDDPRLQAEAYIRSIQNTIVDQVALRNLLAARIRMRLEKGDIKDARELLNQLRQLETYESISAEMRTKRALLETDSSQQNAMISQLFDQARTMLVKYVNEQIVRELEAEVNRAETGSPGTATPPSSAT